jgi:hypothetical protein
MTETDIIQYISELEGVDIVSSAGDTYFFYNPPGAEADHRFPFATLVTGDRHDQFSNLDRDGIYRLNIGVSKQTFRTLFPENSAAPVEGDPSGGHDFTALDTIMPHPVYGSMYWLCVLNPSAMTFEKIKEFLAEAYETAVKKKTKKHSG